MEEAFFENEPKYFREDQDIELLVSQIHNYDEIIIVSGKRIIAKSGDSLYAITDHEIRSGEMQGMAKMIIGSSFFSDVTVKGKAVKEFPKDDLDIIAECFLDKDKLYMSIKRKSAEDTPEDIQSDLDIADNNEGVSINSEEVINMEDDNDDSEEKFEEVIIMDDTEDTIDEINPSISNDNREEEVIIDFEDEAPIKSHDSDIDQPKDEDEDFNFEMGSLDDDENTESEDEVDSALESDNEITDEISQVNLEKEEASTNSGRSTDNELSIEEKLDLKFNKLLEDRNNQKNGINPNSLDSITGMQLKRSKDIPFSEFLLDNEPVRFTGTDNSLLKRLLLHMAKFNASGLFIKGGNYIWMSVQGKKRKITTRKLNDQEATDLLNIAYKSNTASVTIQQKKPLNFVYQMIHAESEGGRLRFRVNAVANTTDNSKSMTITFRLIQTIPPTIEQLKIPEDIVKACEENDKGIIYVAGATGQGKSTTLAAIMRHILEKEDANINMVDIGEPIEYTMDLLDLPSSFVTSLNVGEDIPSFSKAVENCMRMEPQIIQISESRDIDTIEASLGASKSGHGVYTTIHSGSVAESLRRIINMFPADTRDSVQLDVIESTKMIIAQKLIETVDDKRVAIREYLIFTPEVREHLWNATNIGQKAIEMVERFGHPMTEDLKKVYDEGIISEEVYKKRKKDYDNEVNAAKRDNA